MGLETAAAVMAAVAVAGKVGKMGAEINAASAAQDALDLQSKEQQLHYQQKTMANLDAVQKVLDAQTAQMTVRGTSFASPSFNAIQRATVNIGAKRASNIEIEGDLAQANIHTEKQNVKSKLYASLFGDTSDLAMDAFSVYTKMPQMGE